MVNKALKILFIKILTPGLAHKLCNQLDDWLDWLILANHEADYNVCRLTRELKSLRIRPVVFFK